MPQSATPPETDDARLQRGIEWFKYLMVRDGTAPTSPMVEVASIGFCFADVWTRPGLDVRSRRLLTLACVVMTGAEWPIRTHVRAALMSGDLSFEEMQEVVLQISVYAGLPRASVMERMLAECWAEVQAEGGPVKLEPPA